MLNQLLDYLPPYQGKERILVNGSQTAKQIRDEVVRAHSMYAAHYDTIADQFGNDPVKQLFDFCQRYLKYSEEPGRYQTTRSPAAIIELGKNSAVGVDCKHYANFIAGTLAAIERNGKGKFNVTYRFVNYKGGDPNHVFVVVRDRDGEKWIDPTPIKLTTGGYLKRAFNDRYIMPVTIIDKKPDNMIASISGAKAGTAYKTVDGNDCGCGDIKMGNIVGDAATDATLAAAGSLAGFLPEGGLKNFLTSFFQNPTQALINLIKGRTYTSGEYALGEIYMRNILGMMEIQSRQQVPDAYAVQARQFFTVALGVHIGSGDHLNELVKSVDAYYSWMPSNVDSATPRPALERAHKILKQLNYGPSVRDSRWPLPTFGALPYVYPIPDLTAGSLYTGVHPILNINIENGYPISIQPTPTPIPTPGGGPVNPPPNPPPGPPGPGPEGNNGWKYAAFGVAAAGLLYVANTDSTKPKRRQPKRKKVGALSDGTKTGIAVLSVAALAAGAYWLSNKGKLTIHDKREFMLKHPEIVTDARITNIVKNLLTDDEVDTLYQMFIHASKYGDQNPPAELAAKWQVLNDKYNIAT